MIIITLKDAIQDFYNLLAARRTVPNVYAQVARARSCASCVQQWCAYHVQHVMCHVE